MTSNQLKVSLESKISTIVDKILSDKLPNLTDDIKISISTDLQSQIKIAQSLDVKVDSFDTRLNNLEQTPTIRYKVHPFFWAISNPLLLGVLTVGFSLFVIFITASEDTKKDFKWINNSSIPIPLILGGLTVIGTGVIKNYEALDKGGQAIMKQELDYGTRAIIRENNAIWEAKRIEEKKQWDTQRAEDQKRYEAQRAEDQKKYDAQLADYQKRRDVDQKRRDEDQKRYAEDQKQRDQTFKNLEIAIANLNKNNSN